MISAGKVYTELMLKGGAKFGSGLKKAKARLNGFASGAMRIGRSMTMVGLAAAVPFTAGVKVFADFEQQMANVSTMVDDVATHMPRLTKGVEDLSVKSGESTETLTKGLYDILSASIPAEKALDVLAVSARAAKGGMTDTGVAADAITTLLNSYGLSADKAGSVSDLLFSIVKRGKTTFAELAPSIGMVATTAASSNVSLEEMGAALSTMTRNGVRTQNAVTALNAILSTFLKPSSDAAKYAKSLGFALSSATLKSEGLVGVFQRISELPSDAVAKLFPNIRALRGVLPALKNMGGFMGDIAIMANRTGATDKAYVKMAATMNMAFGRVKQAGIAVFRELGAVMEKPVTAAVEAIFDYLKTARKWIKENKNLILGIAGVMATLLSMSGAIMAVAATAKVLAFALGGLGIVFAIIKGLFIATVAVIGFIFSPIGLVIAAVAALGGAILYFTDTGGKALDWLVGKFGRLKDFVGTTLGAIGKELLAGNFAAAANVALSALIALVQTAITKIEGYWIGFKAFYMKIVTQLAHGGLIVINNLQAGWENAVSAMSVAIVGLFTSVQSIWNEMHGWLAKKMLDVAAVFDKSLDLKAAKKLVDIEVTERSKGGKAWLSQTIEDDKTRTGDIESKRKEREGQIVTTADSELAAQKKKYDDELAASRAALAKAKAEWRRSVAEAETIKKSEKDDLHTSGGKGFEASGVKTAINTAMKKTDVAGSFYANLAGLSAGPAADRTAKATESIVKNTKETNKLLQKGKLVYQ